MKIKYPKSWHLPYSKKLTRGDRKHSTANHFIGKTVVVSIKLDGENTSIYNDFIHARSTNSDLDSEDRRWIDALRVAKIQNELPSTYRICGENLFYQHTCKYNNLQSLFYIFSIWDNNICLSWEDTKEWCDKLGVEHVSIIYQGIYDEKIIEQSFKKYCEETENDVEGFVVRVKDSFDIKDFKFSLNKFVRKSFQIGSSHWRHSKKILNKLENDMNPWDILY
mgnify:CR=1 FL=1